MKHGSLTGFAWLSLGAAALTIALKTIAYLLTGSVGLLSDALESLINLTGAAVALIMLKIAERPADEEHTYGHGKAEYFSSGFEGTMILLAAIGIVVTAVHRLITPRPLEQVGVGLAVSVAASAINFGVARLLLLASRRHDSVTLEANAKHLMTDVWTSGGVIVGVCLVQLTHWQRLDPIVALLVAANIIWTGVRIVIDAAHGLMDTSIPAGELSAIKGIFERHTGEMVQFHALRTRRAGVRRFVSFHVLVPGEWSVHRGHEYLEMIEAEVREVVPQVTVFTHLEPAEDPASWDDLELDRAAVPPGGVAGPPR